MSVKSVIEARVQEAFAPVHCEVHNESHMHSVPPDSETHFKLVLVSESFEGQRKVARHRAVYSLLQDQLDAGVHALALHTYTAQEWQEKNNQSPASPNCMGGSKADQ